MEDCLRNHFWPIFVYNMNLHSNTTPKVFLNSTFLILFTPWKFWISFLTLILPIFKKLHFQEFKIEKFRRIFYKIPIFTPLNRRKAKSNQTQGKKNISSTPCFQCNIWVIKSRQSFTLILRLIQNLLKSTYFLAEENNPVFSQ